MAPEGASDASIARLEVQVGTAVETLKRIETRFDSLDGRMRNVELAQARTETFEEIAKSEGGKAGSKAAFWPSVSVSAVITALLAVINYFAGKH